MRASRNGRGKAYCPSVHDPTVIRRNSRRETREPVKNIVLRRLENFRGGAKQGIVVFFESEESKSVSPTTAAGGGSRPVRRPTGIGGRRARFSESDGRRGREPTVEAETVRLTSLFSCASADLNVRLIHSFTSKLSSENAATS